MFRHLLYVVLPSTAVMGSLLPGVGRFFVFRLLVIVLLGTSILFILEPRRPALVASGWRLLSIIWLLFGLLGLVSAIDVPAGISAIAALIIGLLLVNAMLYTDNALVDLKYLQLGWVIAFILTGSIGFRELVTGEHLPNYFASHSTSGNLDYSLVASVFGNSNAFGAFLVAVAPLLMKGLSGSRNWLATALYGILCFACVLLVLASGSRLCLLALFLEVVFVIVFGGVAFRRRLVAVTALALVGVGVFASDAARVVTRLPAKLLHASPSEIMRELGPSASGSSGGQRLSVYGDGLWMMWTSHGLGVGPGNFESVMKTEAVPFPTRSIVDPHSAYIEVLAEYGLLVFLLACIVAFRCLGAAWRAVRSDEAEIRQWGIATCGILIGSSLSVMANSSWLRGSDNWMIVGTVILASTALSTAMQDPAERSPMTSATRSRLGPSGRRHASLP